MRVLMLDPNSNTLGYDRALAAALALAGCSVELAIAPFPLEPAMAAEDDRVRQRFFRPIGGRLGAGLARRPTARRLVKAAEYPLDWLALCLAKARQRPDVLHVQWSLWPAFDALTWTLTRGAGIPVVYTVHNVLPHAPRPGDARRYGRLYAAADGLVVHGPWARQQLVERFAVPPARVTLAPMGALLSEEAATETATARATLGLPPDDPVVLFAGLIEPYKGLPDLVEAFVRLAAAQPRARLVIAGRANTPVADLAARVAGAGLANRVHWVTRFLPQAELALYFSAAAVVVLPYRAVTGSAVLATARRFGRPVLATAVGDLATAIADGEDGRLVPPADPPALASALGELLTAPAEAQRLGEAGRRRAWERDTWEAAAEQTLALYQRLVTGRHAR